MKKSIALANDHAGYTMKKIISGHLEKKGYRIKDFGSNSDKAVDYPDYAHPLAAAVEKGLYEFGITFCGSGNGINMVTNKHQKIRAALCWNEEISRLARAHNDANVCSIPARFIDADTAKRIVDIFLSTKFDGDRHSRRIEKIPLNPRS
ncbi:MAG: ribose 5-phosphate isomerase B [Bacteroidales bacterium]|nr:ribose 5-phosphate isomerase B [Bacteroidales bacterium]MBN2699076.1 ribose 5-phosphate isomerase B [Bacteroidales bacterium]